MARYLVYTSPARGHLYPIVQTLEELRRRGHEVAVRTLASQVDPMRGLGGLVGDLDKRIRWTLERAYELGGLLADHALPAGGEVRKLFERVDIQGRPVDHCRRLPHFRGGRARPMDASRTRPS